MGVLPPVLSRLGCTGPPCKKVTNYWRQQKYWRLDITDFRQTLAVNISASRHPIKNGKNKK
jgi:hypothetical protein